MQSLEGKVMEILIDEMLIYLEENKVYLYYIYHLLMFHCLQNLANFPPNS